MDLSQRKLDAHAQFDKLDEELVRLKARIPQIEQEQYRLQGEFRLLEEMEKSQEQDDLYVEDVSEAERKRLLAERKAEMEAPFIGSVTGEDQ